MRFSFLLLPIILLTTVVVTPNVGCTAAQVEGVIAGANQIIDQAISPVAEKQGVDGVGPYIRLAATFIRDIAYKGVDLLRFLSPNAGEPVVAGV